MMDKMAYGDFEGLRRVHDILNDFLMGRIVSLEVLRTCAPTPVGPWEYHAFLEFLDKHLSR